MIELIYNEEEEYTIEKKTLLEPKNVKQVGEPGNYKKIFIEDYVHTFLTHHSMQRETDITAAILLGKIEKYRNKKHLYIKSAFPLGNICEKQGKYCFTEKMWGDIYQECEKYFRDQEIIGWFLAKSGISMENTAVIEETHRTYFSGADKLLFMQEPMRQKQVFWGFDGNRFTKQPGYYIYYDKNEPMREFMMLQNEEQKEQRSGEKPDIAVASFRKIIKEKQEKNMKRKKRAISCGRKIAIALVLFVGAAALKNQKEQIHTMKEQLGILSENTEIQEVIGDEVVVEELTGDVEAGEDVLQEPADEPEQEAVQEPVENIEEAVEEVSAPVYEEYVVQAGDTLAKICRERYGSDERISEICSLNEITNGDYIQEGEIILLP